jgi:hypothetical protein
MCKVVQRGMRTLHAAWDSERQGKQPAARLFRHPEWESIRERLLEGLRAVHLVCSADLLKSPDDFSVGVATLEQACDLSSVRWLVAAHASSLLRFAFALKPICSCIASLRHGIQPEDTA